MDPDPSSSIVILALSLLASAFFSGMEMAFVASNRLQTELQSQHSLRGKVVSYLTRHPQMFIATMLVETISQLVLCGIESATLISEGMFGVSGWQFASQPMLVLISQTLLTTGVVLVLAEFIRNPFFTLPPTCG